MTPVSLNPALLKLSSFTKSIFISCALLSFGTGCTMRPPKPRPSQLEIRQFQTREYETRNTKMVMKALLNVLQDDGFIAKNAVVELGLITATKEVDIENQNEVWMNSFFYGSNAVWRKNSIIEASANVTEFGKVTRVRINFQMKNMDNRGGVISVKSIEDPNYYQDFFSKVDKGIFIEREKV